MDFPMSVGACGAETRFFLRIVTEVDFFSGDSDVQDQIPEVRKQGNIIMRYYLNQMTYAAINEVRAAVRARTVRIESHEIGGATVFDFNNATEEAGVLLARLCMGDRGTVTLGLSQDDELMQLGLTQVSVETMDPISALLRCQFAGWQFKLGKESGMISGPIRAVRAREEYFEEFGGKETANVAIGVLECPELPSEALIAEIANQTSMHPKALILACARTGSRAAAVQVAARTCEAGIHGIHDLGFDVTRIKRVRGNTLLIPYETNDWTALDQANTTNTYAGFVEIWVTSDIVSTREVMENAVSSAAASYGSTFAEAFEAAGCEFSNMDAEFFRPAKIRVHYLQDDGAIVIKDYGEFNAEKVAALY